MNQPFELGYDFEFLFGSLKQKLFGKEIRVNLAFYDEDEVYEVVGEDHDDLEGATTQELMPLYEQMDDSLKTGFEWIINNIEGKESEIEPILVKCVRAMAEVAPEEYDASLSDAEILDNIEFRGDGMVCDYGEIEVTMSFENAFDPGHEIIVTWRDGKLSFADAGGAPVDA